MLVREELSSSDLSPIHAAATLQMQPSFSQLFSHCIRVHLFLVESVVPDGEGGAWRSAQNPVRTKVINELEGFVPI